MIDLSVQYNKNRGLILNPTELRQLYLYGIKIQSKDSTEMTDSTYMMYIESAQEEIEKYLGIKLNKQIINEDLNFYRDEFENFGFMRTVYPCVKCYGLNGFIGTIKQIEYPLEWLSTRRTTDGYSWNRHIYIVPNFGNVKTGSIVYNGIVPYLGILGYSQIPNYWSTTYVTGFDKVPSDLLNVIGMMAACMALGVAGDLILSPGLGNQSLSIDGLSQSVSNVAFKQRIQQYLEHIKLTLSRIRTNYRGIAISAM